MDLGFLVDPLSITMALFVTGIGTLIHLYSIGYMHGDPKFSKFFVYLNLFVFSMLMLVLGNNLLLTFLGWEGVGACSYFLISFWYADMPNSVAGKKAFVTNRIGDWGYMLGTFLLFSALGTLTYAGIAAPAPANTLGHGDRHGDRLLLFVGAVGKSAQLPLYVWLPDAMAGPTPVSALIHAATMVTSGVYLMVRIAPVLAAASPWMPTLIAWVGALTALFAATVAVSQRDIKKVLAYSTVSQLGYMFLAVGSGAYVAAIFHMITHAFFKALLFLGAGSVIHGMHDEQDMKRMGALRKLMPITAITFIVGWLSIAGVPPFSGFWSKDEILLNAWQKSPALWVIGLITALLTAFYMSRQVFMVFYGKARWDRGRPADVDASVARAMSAPASTAVHRAGARGRPARPECDPHESPWTMTVPLVVLAVLAAFGGLINLPFHGWEFLADWLRPVVGRYETEETVSTVGKVVLAADATISAFVGIGVGYLVYLKRPPDPADRARRPRPRLVLRRGGGRGHRGGPGRKAFEAIAWFDQHVIDGAVNGVGTLVRAVGPATPGAPDRIRPQLRARDRRRRAAVMLAWFVIRAGV